MLAGLDSLHRQGLTILSVAHRREAMARCRRTVLLRQGKVLGQGTHSALLSSHPYYQALWEGASQ